MSAADPSPPSLQWRRPTDWFVVDDLAEALAVAFEHGDRLVVDVENTLVGYGSTADERRAAIDETVATVAAHGGFRRLAFVSNARFELPPVSHAALLVEAVTAARKPYVRLPPLRRLRAALAGAAVYGDQPFTDGLLARNLGGIWIQPRHAHDPQPAEPWWPRAMRSAGRRLVERRFRLHVAAG